MGMFMTKSKQQNIKSLNYNDIELSTECKNKLSLIKYSSKNIKHRLKWNIPLSQFGQIYDTLHQIFVIFTYWQLFTRDQYGIVLNGFDFAF